MSTPSLSKVETRERLKPRREPYWARVKAGQYLGFRKMTAASPGAWLARWRDGDTGKQHHAALGEFADLPLHERFDAARRAADRWFGHLDGGGTSTAITVEQACAAYVTHLHESGRTNASHDAAKRFARWVDSTKFGRTELQRLKPAEVWAWRTLLASTNAIPQDKEKQPTRPRAASTLNRDMTTLRAALNLALENGWVTTDAAWKVKLRPVKDADGRRDVYLDIDQRRRLIEHAQSDLRDFLRALSLVPLRPGAMAALLVGDFDQRLSTLKIGKDKNGADRKITLPKATAEFFSGRCTDRETTDPLLCRSDLAAWNKDSWKYPVKAAVLAGGLPSKVTAYALRHSVITDLIALHKLDTLTVAQLSGTSLLMIEKHYGHLLRDHAARALASLVL